MHLAPQEISVEVLAEKYAKDGETTHDEIFRRVANGLAQAEKPELRDHWMREFYQNMVNGAIGAGRIMSAAGTGIKATLANCFVQPVGDCAQGVDQNGYPGIYDALRMAAETMRRGGGVGYDFSRLRPKGSKVKGTHSEASGPCSFMDVFDVSCKTVESAGARRGAQMGVLRIDHPDVLDFIEAKRTKGRWNNFNVSVGVTDAFMRALEAGEQWQLVHVAEPSDKQIAAGAFQRDDGKWVYKTIAAKEMWDLIMRSTYNFAEPGILFIDKMNKDNNLHWIEIFEATNPCAEQCLPPYGCCDLGPIILPRFVRNPFGFGAKAEFDFAGFAKAVSIQVRMLDNVLDVTMWPLPEQQTEAKNKRRIGVGFTGLGNALAMLGLRYDSGDGRQMAKDIAATMRDAAYLASVELAREKGAFPLFDADKYLNGEHFAARLPAAIKDQIRQHGIRNSHLLSIAPTGTVSLAFADNASNGIEPPFSYGYRRKKRLAQEAGHKFYDVQDHAFRQFLALADVHVQVFKQTPGLSQALLDAVMTYKTEFEYAGKTWTVKSLLPESFVTALEMSADDHLAMMAAVQPFIDTSISKTVNVPADYPFADFKDLYLKAWKAGLKGLATYRPNDTLGSVLDVPASAPAVKAPDPVAVVEPDVDPLKVVIQRRPEGQLPGIADKLTYYTHEGKKSLYVIMSFTTVDGNIAGAPVSIERPVEVFIPAGQSGEAQQWVTAAMRSLSLAARGGFIAKALQDMRKVSWDRGPVRCGVYEKQDGTRAPLYHDSEVAAIGYSIQNTLIQRGYLDADGNQVPTSALMKRGLGLQVPTPALQVESATPAPASGITPGKKCPECGAHAVVKRDGCEFCTSCGHVGSCG